MAKTPPDQLIIGMNMNNLLTLDPAAMTGNEVVGIVVNLYDSLVELDPEQLHHRQARAGEIPGYQPRRQNPDLSSAR